MAVPKYDDLFNPLLEALRLLGSSGSVSEIDEKVADVLNLSEKDRNEIQQLQKEIEAIKARNKRVEGDKAWETSMFRRVSISVVTYLVVLAFMLVTKAANPYINSLVPALAYLLGNISLSVLKSWWLEKRKAF